MVMLAEYGTMSLKDVLEPSIQMADGYPIEASAAGAIERQKGEIKKWPPSARVFLTHPGEAREAARSGRNLQASRSGDDASKAGRDRADGAEGRQEPQGGHLRRVTTASTRVTSPRVCTGLAGTGRAAHVRDLATWKVKIEEPVMTTYKGIDVYKLTVWTQGPALLQALNMLEGMDLKGMGFNSARYIHTTSIR